MNNIRIKNYRLFTIYLGFSRYVLNASYLLHTGGIDAIKRKIKHHFLSEMK